MHQQIIIIVLAIAVLIAASVFIKSALSRFHLPPFIGYILLGSGISYLTGSFSVLSPPAFTEEIFTFLADIGIIVLLFRIGLDSDIKSMLRNLTKAGFVGFTALIASIIVAYYMSHLALGLSSVASLLIAAAFAATSIGIPASIWQKVGKINTQPGQLFIDMAELDDIAGVIIMALLFAVLGDLSQPAQQIKLTNLILTIVILLLKLAAFTAFCCFFSRYLEKPLMHKISKIEQKPDPSIIVIALGIIIASIAGLAGFSIAIGAFFAGLIFSRDPQSFKDKTAFDVFYDLFTPFFFINIGLQIEFNITAPILLPVIILFIAASLGKFIGAWLPALFITKPKTASALAVGMIPRAEITLIISQAALSRKIIDQNIYIAIILTVLLTCIIPTTILRHQLGEIKCSAKK